MTTFRLIWELPTPTRPGMNRIGAQVAALADVADEFLVPDNHLGHATVSSIAVAHAVTAAGGQAITCLNARDRNVLGLQRDLLTAATYGLGRILCVYGDDPAHGSRTRELTTRTMVDHIRAYQHGTPFEVGVTMGLGRVPRWKLDADFAFAQLSFSLRDLFRWRDALAFDAPVHAGMLVLQSPRTAAAVPGLRVPPALLERVAADPRAGVDAACEAVAAIRDHGGFAGVHLVALNRARELADAIRQARVRTRRRPRRSSTAAVQPGGTTTVSTAPSTIAGPLSSSPGTSRSRWYTAVSTYALPEAGPK